MSVQEQGFNTHTLNTGDLAVSHFLYHVIIKMFKINDVPFVLVYVMKQQVT